MRIADHPVRFPVVPRRVPVEQPSVWKCTFAGLPPATNNIYLTAGHRRVLTPTAKAWRDSAVSTLIATGAAFGWRLPSEPLAIHIRLTPGNKRLWDVDGRQKLVIDALVESGLLDDDNRERVAFVSAQALPPEKVARTELAVELFAAWRARVGVFPWA